MPRALGIPDYATYRIHGDLILGGITDQTLRVAEMEKKRIASVWMPLTRGHM